MADVFLSYSRKDRAKIEPIAAALGKLGVVVWYDARLQSGSSFDEVIASELDNAALVVACWSPDAIVSKWTRSEALFALDQQKLAAVFLEPCKLNPPFNLIHADDLTEWTERPGHLGFAQLIERIASALQRPGLVEMGAALAGGDAALYGWAKRYPEEPKAKEIWRAASARHAAEFETEIEAARSEIEHLATTRKEAALARLAACRDSFKSWIDAERTGNAVARPKPRSSVESLFDSQEGLAAKAEADRLSREARQLQERLAQLGREGEFNSAKAAAAQAALSAAHADLAERKTRLETLERDRAVLDARAEAAEAEAARARQDAAGQAALQTERDALAARVETQQKDLAEAERLRDGLVLSARDRYVTLQRERDDLAAKLRSAQAETARACAALAAAEQEARAEKERQSAEAQELEQALAEKESRHDATTADEPLVGAAATQEPAKFYEGRYSVFLGAAAIIVLWIFALILGSGSPLIPAPGQVLDRLTQGPLWLAVGRTLVNFVIGASLGAFSAAVLIAVLKRIRASRFVLVPILRVLAPLPLIAALPLAMAWFGYSYAGFAVIAFATGLVVISSFEAGSKSPWGDELSRGAASGSRLRPMMRRCMAIALLLTISSEMIGSEGGVGAYMLQGAMSDWAAAIIVLAAMGFVLDRATGGIADRLVRRS